MLFSWMKVINHLPETYASDNVIEETETEMQNFKMLSNMTPKQYFETFCSRAFRCNQVYTKYTVKGIFVE